MISVTKISGQPGLEQAFAIRQRVFVEEQQVDPALEYDEFETSANHYLACDGDSPVGTARWRMTDKGIKLERFAVLKACRKSGAGSALLQAVLKDVLPQGKPVYLHAQVQVVSFYQKYGFRTTGDEFMEAGIRHHKMILDQDAASQ